MLQTDWNGKPYHSLDYELKKIFGKKVYKLALDGGSDMYQTGMAHWEEAAVSFAVPADLVILQKSRPDPLESRLTLRRPASAGRSQEMTLPISRISSHTQTLMPHSPI